jgi:hypothetical protein
MLIRLLAAVVGVAFVLGPPAFLVLSWFAARGGEHAQVEPPLAGLYLLGVVFGLIYMFWQIKNGGLAIPGTGVEAERLRRRSRRSAQVAATVIFPLVLLAGVVFDQRILGLTLLLLLGPLAPTLMYRLFYLFRSPTLG